MGRTRKIDITGQRFNKLLVLREYGRKHKEVTWECLCDCGNITIVPSYAIRTGATKSCGCYTGKTKTSFRESMRGTHIHTAYTNMLTRCYNPHYYLFQHYGGKGIKVCDDWLGDDGFINFYNWSLANGCSGNLSIDRIDNSKNYSPDNCRWVTMKEQQNNRTNNRMITVNGETHTIAEWSRINKIKYATIQNRLKYGWSEQDAVTLRACHASRRSRTNT